jgi:hypothetical protein
MLFVKSFLKYALYFILGVAVIGFGLSAEDKDEADKLAPIKIRYPAEYSYLPINSGLFTNLSAQAVAGKIQVVWETPLPLTNASATLFYSADYPDHIASRDWRALVMVNRGSLFNASIPVDDIDIPIVYFVMERSGSQTNLSPMRICNPRKVGLEVPSRPFWQFLEGFEETTINWHILNNYPEIPPLRTNVVSKNGKAALCVSLPEGRRSISVGTSRLRGWQIENFKAKGFSVWLRTKQGNGAVQFSLVCYAFTDKQQIAQHPTVIPISGEWKRIEINFNSFPRINLMNVDMLVFEFSGTGKTEFLIDDLSLTGISAPEIE